MSEEEKKDEKSKEEAEKEQEQETEDSSDDTETKKEDTSEEKPENGEDADTKEGEEKAPDDKSVDEKSEEAQEPEAAPEAQDIDRTKITAKDIKPGMTIRVHEKITDIDPRGEARERTQMFEGMVLSLRGSGVSRTMTMRRVHKGYGVEKIFPIHSPIIQKIELVKHARVRRSKLNYLKGKKGRFKRKLKEEHVE